MDRMADRSEGRRLVAAAATTAGRLLMFSWRGDGTEGRGRGELLLRTAEETRTLLSTGVPLSALWISPGGDVWVGSDTDTLFTTRRLPAHMTGAAIWDGGNGRMAGGGGWTTTALPACPGQAMAHGITAIWGTADDDVYVTTADARLFRFDGLDWRHVVLPRDEMAEDCPPHLTQIAGRGPDDIWIIGFHGTILHNDGTGWRAVPYPADAHPLALLSCIAFADDGTAWLCTHEGQLLAGTPAGIRLVAGCDQALDGMTMVADRILLASPTAGALLVDPRTWRTDNLAPDLRPTGAFATADVIVLPDPGSKAGFAELSLPAVAARR